jgi:putative DNA primase/helicase
MLRGYGMVRNFDGVERGADYLGKQIAARGGVVAYMKGTEPDWPKPQPLTAKIEHEPYPADALPETIRAAIDEVQGFVQAPYPLVACSALGAISLTCQAHVDVQRAENLRGPSSLYLLTIADSGERKSTCDGFFTSPIRQYQTGQTEAAKPAQSEHRAAMSAWEAKRDGILSAIKAAGRGGDDTETLQADLVRHQLTEPQAPRVPRMILGDETPESLAWSLAKLWPSAGVISSEAGTVLGSHGMGKDSIMRNLGLLNVLWDGGAHDVGRRTSECFTAHDVRLTMALQIQEATLRDYLEKARELPRGSGFFARFLVAWPESTQGKRLFKESQGLVHLAAFRARFAKILNTPLPIDENGTLSPAVLTFTPEAKTAWVAFHDAVEEELGSGGELHDVRDVASKIADNAARLAALFHFFGGDTGAIGAECFAMASRIVAWHLSESRRFFGELALPPEMADAARLDNWLIKHCRRERTHIVGKRHAQQYGPVRNGARLDAAISYLVELDRLRVEKNGNRITLYVNPALFGVVS